MFNLNFNQCRQGLIILAAFKAGVIAATYTTILLLVAFGAAAAVVGRVVILLPAGQCLPPCPPHRWACLALLGFAELYCDTRGAVGRTFKTCIV